MALPRSHSNSEYKNNEEPLSRFWACFFSGSIFALFWTQKMEKTIKWIPIFILFIFVWFIIDHILYPYIYEINAMPNFIDQIFYYEYDMKQLELFVNNILNTIDNKLIPISYSKELVSFLSYTMIVFYDLIMYVGSIILLIHLMFKWTTQYNLKHFGYESKSEWKKTINNKYNTQQIMKKELKIIGNEVVDNIVKTVSKIKHKTKTGDDEVIEKINKWHTLMEKGIISEIEFESKKAELLGR